MTGSIIRYGGVVPPAGYLICNGQAVSRATYAALFAVIGETFGPGDGVSTFNVPDLRGVYETGPGGPIGAIAVGDEGGSTTST